MKSVYDAVKSLTSLIAAVRTANANGAVIDTKNYNSAKLVIATGDLTTVDETYVFKIQEGDESDLSDAADISGATVAITADDQVGQVRLDGLGNDVRKRYIRAVLTVSGSNPSIPCTAVFELGNAFRQSAN